MSYEPRAGTKAAQFIDLLRKRPGVPHTSSVMLAKVPSTAGIGVPLREAIAAGVIVVGKEGREATYTYVEEEAAGEPGAFQCAQYSDGELCIHNAGADGDESITLTRDQADVLRRYLGASPAWTEQIAPPPPRVRCRRAWVKRLPPLIGCRAPSARAGLSLAAGRGLFKAHVGCASQRSFQCRFNLA